MSLLALLLVLLALLLSALLLFRGLGLDKILLGNSSSQLFAADGSLSDLILSEVEVPVVLGLGVRAWRGLVWRGSFIASSGVSVVGGRRSRGRSNGRLE